MKSLNLLWCVWLCCIAFPLQARDYYVATDGDDTQAGTPDAPFATLSRALSVVEPGDKVRVRGGTYRVTKEWVMTPLHRGYARVFDVRVKATRRRPIVVEGCRGERPVFDLSAVRYADRRVTVFHVSGDYWHFRNFEVVGTQVGVRGHTQSECFRIDGGSHNVCERIDCHDGMAIGFYLVRGAHNLILNCDAHDNYDGYSEGDACENVDGFGGHMASERCVGNAFRGCRAWNNGDDGFDLIGCRAPFTIEDCWSFRNGCRPHSTAHGGGNGFKSGGYGMSPRPRVPREVPVHAVRRCLAYANKGSGFYANHHPGGLLFEHNTACANSVNYNMLNRRSPSEAVNVDGYGHVLRGNLSYKPRRRDAHLRHIDLSSCRVEHNSFAPEPILLTDADFESVDDSVLTAPRQSDGSLPDISFLCLSKEGRRKLKGIR